MNKLPVILETSRLILKQPTMDELDELIALRTDTDVMRYIGDGSVQSKEQVVEFINLADSYYKKTGFTLPRVSAEIQSNYTAEKALSCFNISL